MRYIDADKLMRDINEYHLSDGKFQHWVEVQPTVDVVEVVRCKNCLHGSWCEDVLRCTIPDKFYTITYRLVTENDFCSKGERVEE